jgi:hypothetical protein
MEEFRAKAQHRQLFVGADSGGAWHHFFFMKTLSWSSICALKRVWDLREKSLAPGSWAGDGGVYVASFLKASSWRACIRRLAFLLLA